MTPVDKPDAAMDWAYRAARAVNDTLDVHQINDSAIAEIIRRHAAAEKPKGIAVEAELREQLADLQSTFDLRWQADQRAIQRWQEATGHTDTWPDHADLVMWLMEQLDEAQSECQEQARLLGMSGEREAALRAQLASREQRITLLEKERDRLTSEVAELRKTVTGYQQGLATGLVAINECELSGLKEAGDRMAAMLETAPSAPIEEEVVRRIDAARAQWKEAMWGDAARKEAQ